MRFHSPFLIILSLLFLIATITQSQDFPIGSCGEQAGGALCAEGFCCSKWGWCGNTTAYCDPENCQTQCPPPPPPSPPPPPPPPPQGINCGINHGGALCPTGMCCNFFGFCSDLSLALCNSGNCISQCGQPPICGVDAGGALCGPDDCCTIAGLCTHRTPFNLCSLPTFCQSGCSFHPTISMLKAIA